jgi:uncharacterized phage protein (TIGR01671 family)
MKREIKFRGKFLDNGVWKHGYLCENGNRHLCIQEVVEKIIDGFAAPHVIHPIDPATVGQFTGLLDKNGEEIYEEDIVKYSQNEYVVRFGSYDTHSGYKTLKKERFCASRFYLELVKVLGKGYNGDDVFTDLLCENGYAFLYLRDEHQYSGNFEKYNQEWGIEVIGNIHDNPKLLKGE